jgi:hypothetical protein
MWRTAAKQPNKRFSWHVGCLRLLPLNLSHVFFETTLFHTLLASACLPTIFDKSLGLSWGHFGLAKDALILVEGVTKNRHMCRFFVTPSTQSASWIGAPYSFYCTVCAHSRLLYIPLDYG